MVESSETSAANGRAGLVTVIGEAGSGKSRLLWEFFKYIDGIGATRWWHQGRCLSYGEGVAYWAVAEMVRARAGILEEEEPASAWVKLRAVIEKHVPEERERRLIEPRLAHLLGLEQRTATEAADLFSGWRLFFERMAQTDPVILAFEDLQWADSGLLEFIDYLLEWSAEFPIFIIALGRPEVEIRRAGWGTVVRLGALEPAAMRDLLDSVVPGLPAELLSRILERAEGVPLYAAETVRMLLDRGVLTQEGQRYVVSRPVADLEVPETLQALVAARLDSLNAVERPLVQDAAVLGMSFSTAAVAAVSGRPEPEVRHALDGLVAKQVLGRDDDARMAEQGQYHFLQGILRTIALSTLSRRDRKASHLAAAEHLRTIWGDTTEIAEVLASHYLEAVEADPTAPDADAIRASARETLASAGHRAFSLALGVEARRYFEQAAALTGEDVERARLLADAGDAAARSGDLDGAHELLNDAIAVLDEGGRDEDAARTRALLANVLINENRLTEAGDLIDRAREVLSADEVLAELAARRARIAFLTGDNARAHAEAERAISIADPRGLIPLFAEAAITKANTLQYEGRLMEAESLQSLGLKLALENDVTDQALRAYFNLAEYRLVKGHPDESAQLLDEGMVLARERGIRAWERDLRAERAGVHAFSGEWDEALAAIGGMHFRGQTGRVRLASIFAPLILAARGDTGRLESWLAEPVDSSEWRELILIQQTARGVALRALGQLDESARLVAGAVSRESLLGGLTHAYYLGEVLDTLIEAQQISVIQQLLESSADSGILMVDAQAERARGLLEVRQGAFAEAEARLARAAAMLRDTGNPFELARALLDDGRVLFTLGRSGEAATVLEKAASIFAKLGATPWLERTQLALEPTTVPAD